MKSEYSEKTTLKYPPCKQPEQSCVEYDYDPCEYSDDITEKDLAVLLKEEEKLLRERKEEQNKEEQNKEEKNKEHNKEQNKEQKEQEEEKEEAKLERLSVIPVGKSPEERRDLPQSVKPVKKCKKVIKNPFFNNRLEFSRCLPPPPPTPPPQFFPTFEEDEVRKCTRKRKKKCEKIKPYDEDTEKHTPPEGEVDKEKNKREEKKEKTEKEEKEEEKEKADEEKEEKEKEKEEEKEKEKEKEEEKEKEKEEEKERKEEKEDRQEQEEEKKKEKKEKKEEPEPEDRQRDHKKKCRKIYKPPCRKKSFEISNMFQPRPIPAHQRDLPQTSPLETPEVERQIWLSRKINCQTDCVKNNGQMASFKKKCERKKAKS